MDRSFSYWLRSSTTSTSSIFIRPCQTVLLIAICSSLTACDSLVSNPGLYYGAGRAAALQGDYAKANAFQTMGDVYAQQNQQQVQQQTGTFLQSQPAKVAYCYGVPVPGTPYDPGKYPNVVWGEKLPGTSANVYPAPGYQWRNSDPMDASVDLITQPPASRLPIPWANGTWYGDFKEDAGYKCPWGYGRLELPDGSIWVGKFESVPQEASFSQPNGTRLEGRWVTWFEPISVRGTFVSKDGTTWTGNWQWGIVNVKIGPNAYQSSDHYKFSGTRNGTPPPDGAGTLTWPDGSVLNGVWSEGSFSK